MAISAAGCTIAQTGTAVTLSGEAMTLSGGDTIAQITDTTKRVLDPSEAGLVLYDNGSPVSATAYTVNWLFGKVTKNSGAFTGPMTISGAYLPRHTVAEAKAFELNVQADLADVTTMSSSTTAHARAKCLCQASGSVSGLDNLQTDLDSGGTTIKPWTDLGAGTRRVMSVQFSDGTIFRAFVRFSGVKESAEVADVLNATLEWTSDAATGVTNTTAQSFAWSTD
jgi:hypothetical protein